MKCTNWWWEGGGAASPAPFPSKPFIRLQVAKVEDGSCLLYADAAVYHYFILVYTSQCDFDGSCVLFTGSAVYHYLILVSTSQCDFDLLIVAFRG